MKKEQYEWIYSWCDEADKNDLPRVLLIGDSITNGYYQKVKELLKGKVYCDYMSSSYAIDTKMHSVLVKAFVKDSRYDLIHFNNGLHGIHISKPGYKSRVEKLIKYMSSYAKISLVETTCVNVANNKRPDKKWSRRVKERNDSINELASKYNLPIDALHQVSVEMPIEDRYPDGVHYLDSGYQKLAQVVAQFILDNIK